jgi:hypothetical protein
MSVANGKIFMNSSEFGKYREMETGNESKSDEPPFS